MVPASDADIEIFVRNKRPTEMNTFQPERTLLFVHGATYPASTAFDLALSGASWMDYIASRGYDVYLVDLRGYGRSTRPKEMTKKPEANGPIVRGDTAVKDIGSVVDFILRRRNISPQSARLVLGYHSHGHLHDRTRGKSRAAPAVCAPVDSPDTIADPNRLRSARRLSHGHTRNGQAALVHWRVRRQEGGSYPRGLV